jgi:phage shock protein C
MLLIAGRKGGLGKGSASGKRLYRSREERMVGGVLGGLAEYLGVDATWVRNGFVVLAVLTSVGPAIIVYIIAMIIVPEEPKGAGVEAPVWPMPQPPGTETVQTPPPAPPVPPAPEPPAPPAPAPEPPVPPQA